MDLKKKENYTWVQCRSCGHIYQVPRKYSSETLFIESWCPKCECEVALNCGENEDEIAIFYDLNLDERYYN